MILIASGGVALLARTAADIYTERRAGISRALRRCLRAILGPSSSPLFAGKKLEADALTVPWLAAGGIALIALAIVVFIRPDPKKIAEAIGSAQSSEPPAAAAPLTAGPAVIPAMLVALASFSVMVSVMNLTGYVVVQHHHHTQQDVFPIIGAHVFGMYALVLFVGRRSTASAGASRCTAGSC